MSRYIEEKRNKVDYGPEMGTGLEEDRLSRLPDDIIHHILSFIDTKYAVRTCVLSSRWKLIWTSLPHLNLASYKFRHLPNFTKFVNRLLSRRNNHTVVSTADIFLRGRNTKRFVEKTLSYVMSHNVREVKIVLYIPKGDNQLPPSLFSSESLKYLSVFAHVTHYNASPCPQFPWNFPALTTLVLRNIWLCSEETRILDIFTKCVNLKNLSLENCRTGRNEVMQIFCPQLVNLTLKNGWTSKYAFLTPNLSYFHYNGGSEISLSTDALNCLKSVNLEMIVAELSVDDRQKQAHRLLTVLRELRNVKILRVYLYVIEYLSTVLDILEHEPSPFSNLKCLKIHFCSMRKSTNSFMIDQAIKFLFNSSSNFNVIMELPENLSYYIYLVSGNGIGSSHQICAHERDMQALYKVVDILSSKEMSDPNISQLMEDVKMKLAAHWQEMGILRPRRRRRQFTWHSIYVMPHLGSPTGAYIGMIFTFTSHL